MRRAQELATSAKDLVKKNVNPETVGVVTAAATTVAFLGCQVSSLFTSNTDSCTASSLTNTALPGMTVALLSGVVANPEKALKAAHDAKASAEQAVAYVKQHGVKESAKNAVGGAVALGNTVAQRVSGMIWGKPAAKADTTDAAPSEDSALKPKNA